MAIGILGKKLGMTQVFDKDGCLTPVTVIEAGPCFVSAIKTKEKHGYNALQLTMPKTKRKNTIREIRDFDDEFKIGDALKAGIFKAGDFVDVQGVSIGKGFQGGMKRWNWHGGEASRGSMFHRAPGTMQSGPRLSRVTKGHHLPGHMGSARVTVQNLEVVQVNEGENLIALKGAVPGHKGSVLVIKNAVKGQKLKALPSAESKEKQKKEKEVKPKAQAPVKT